MKKRGGSAIEVFARRAVLEALAETELEVERTGAAGLDGLLWPRIASPWVSGLVIKASASAR
jgi:hypothetical protein